MKIILKIAKTELQKIFYSPVAWLILVIFTFQAGSFFTQVLNEFVRSHELGNEQIAITDSVFINLFGLFPTINGYVYLYIPLLTMGLMSREINTGSIKLLYSSPITNQQIILGKFLSMMVFGLVLIGVVFVYVAVGIGTIAHIDLPALLCGLLGLYLLICAYSAIGIFVSTLTPYMVVAAMGTLGIFALLNYFKGVGQDIELVRDITYWLALSGRVDTFIGGMIVSEDLIYFLTVIALFLGFTILKLQSGRKRTPWYISWGKYIGIILCAFVIGYFSSLPKLMGYIDFTYTKENTLSVSSQKIVAKLPQGVKITTYVNMLASDAFQFTPENFKYDQDRYAKYTRFDPSLKIKYVYYYHDIQNIYNARYAKLSEKKKFDTLARVMNWKFDVLPYRELAKTVDLGSEHYRTDYLIESPDGRKTFLRNFDDAQHLPNEAEISAALKRLVSAMPKIGFLTGQGERSSADQSDRGYYMFAGDKWFRYALINQGFDFENLTLARPVPDNINILIIADMRSGLTPAEQINFDQYISRGGNLMVLGAPGHEVFINNAVQQLGIKLMPGTLVHAPSRTSQTLITANITKKARQKSYYLDFIGKHQLKVTSPYSTTIQTTTNKDFKADTLLFADRDSTWLELQTKDFMNDTAKFEPASGEAKRAYPLMVALTRKIDGKEQKIIVSGNAEWLSNGELGASRKGVSSGNYYMIDGLFNWISGGEAPIDTRHVDPIDNTITIREKTWDVVAFFVKWSFPILLAIAGLIIWIRRRGR